MFRKKYSLCLLRLNIIQTSAPQSRIFFFVNYPRIWFGYITYVHYPGFYPFSSLLSARVVRLAFFFVFRRLVIGIVRHLRQNSIQTRLPRAACKRPAVLFRITEIPTSRKHGIPKFRQDDIPPLNLQFTIWNHKSKPLLIYSPLQRKCKKSKKSCLLGDRFCLFLALYMEGYIIPLWHKFAIWNLKS